MHHQLDRALVHVLDRDAVVAAVGARGRDEAGLAALLLRDGMAHAHLVVGAEAELVLLAGRQHGQRAGADEGAVAEQRHGPGSSGEPFGSTQLGIEVGLRLELRHGAHGEHRLDAVLLQKDALCFAGRRHGEAAGHAEHRLEGRGDDGRLLLDDVEIRLRQQPRRRSTSSRGRPAIFSRRCSDPRRRPWVPARGGAHCGAGLRLGLEVDGDGVDDRRSGTGVRTRGRQLHGDVVPALAGALHDIGAARQLAAAAASFWSRWRGARHSAASSRRCAPDSAPSCRRRAARRQRRRPSPRSARRAPAPGRRASFRAPRCGGRARAS